MSNPRSDLGPQLRRVLADQLAPPPHNIPVRTELGTQIRQSFLTPAAGRVFCAFDYDQLEMRMYGDGIRPNVRRIFEERRR